MLSTEVQWFMESEPACAVSFEASWSSCCSSFYSVCHFCLSSLGQFSSRDELRMEMLSLDTHRFLKNRSVRTFCSLQESVISFCCVNSCYSRMISEIQGKNSRGYFKFLNVNKELSSSDLVPAENSLEGFLILSNISAFAMCKKFLGICHSIDFVLLSSDVWLHNVKQYVMSLLITAIKNVNPVFLHGLAVFKSIFKQ